MGLYLDGASGVGLSDAMGSIVRKSDLTPFSIPNASERVSATKFPCGENVRVGFEYDPAYERAQVIIHDDGPDRCWACENKPQSTLCIDAHHASYAPAVIYYVCSHCHGRIHDESDPYLDKLRPARDRPDHLDEWPVGIPLQKWHLKYFAVTGYLPWDRQEPICQETSTCILPEGHIGSCRNADDGPPKQALKDFFEG